jgi:hypothetical protein
VAAAFVKSSVSHSVAPKKQVVANACIGVNLGTRPLRVVVFLSHAASEWGDGVSELTVGPNRCVPSDHTLPRMMNLAAKCRGKENKCVGGSKAVGYGARRCDLGNVMGDMGVAKWRETVTKGGVQWMGSEDRENPTWVMERLMP